MEPANCSRACFSSASDAVPFRDPAVAGQQPLEGRGPDPALRRQHPGCRRGRGQPEHQPVTGETDDFVQHPRLAGAGETLNANDGIVREKNPVDGVLLPVCERYPFETPGDRHGVRKCLRQAPALTHQGDDLLFGPERPPRGEVPGLRPDQVAVLLQPSDRRREFRVRMAPGITAERRRQQVLRPEHAVTLFEMVQGLPGRFQGRETRRNPRQLPLLPVEPDGARVAREAEGLRLPLPHLRQHVTAGFVLLPARGQRRPSCVIRRVVQAFRLHVAEDVLAPGREGVEEGV